jgi:bifunctional ADP-heptose synthase (sugar kinase/adenylyltransferase)
MLTTALVERILESLPGLTIGLVGDLFLDRYFDIDPALDEPSVETGLTAYQVTGVRSYPGALGTVLNNLAALGVGRIVPVSFVGDDGEGYELKQALGRMACVDTSYLVTTSERRTPTYCKPMRGGVELNRLDIKNRTPTSSELQDRILERAKQAWEGANAWIVLDQVSEADCGVVTVRVRNWITAYASRDSSKFILADSRERIHDFQQVCVKPNEREAASLNPTKVRAVFATKGERGIQLLEGDETRHIPAFPISGPVDICGAGDSCSAGTACAVAAGASFAQAAAFGNLVASITIQQIGITGTATPEQVRRRWADVGGS